MIAETDSQLLSRINSVVETKLNEILVHPRSDNSCPSLDDHRNNWAAVKSPQDWSRGSSNGDKGEEFSKTIDHTLLRPDATAEMIDNLCEEAKKFRFKSVCVNSIWAKRVAENLKGTDIKTCVVVGFPLGASGEGVKAFESTTAIRCGATEIDLVLSIGHLKSNDLLPIYKDILSVVSAAFGAASTTPIKPKVKVILETPLLTPAQIISASVISALAGADFVKTCTGFNTGNLGATADAVSLMFRAVDGIGMGGKKVEVKASGGVRTFGKCIEMIQAGASRIGTSSGAAIMVADSSSSGY